MELETIISGALGALTFGMYWHYISIKQIEEHNRKMDESIKRQIIY
jgi:uncharacterized NAD(P)/FAD-binding protein YdhS